MQTLLIVLSTIIITSLIISILALLYLLAEVIIKRTNKEAKSPRPETVFTKE